MAAFDPSVPDSRAWRSGTILWYPTLFAIGLILFVTLSAQFAPAPALQTMVGSSAGGMAANDPTAELVAQSERLLRAISRVPASTPQLIQGFQHDQGIARRLGAMITLQQRDRQATAALIAALADPNRGVRVAAIQVLGWQQAKAAIEPLLNATFDADVQVREQAVWALGEMGALEAVPRLHELQIAQSSFYVQQSAYLAEQRLVEAVAAALNLGPSEVHLLAATRANGWAYALTADQLYLRRSGVWQAVGGLPDAAIGLSVGLDGTLLYLATVSSGLYRSRDGGQSWERVRLDLKPLTEFAVTGVVVNSQNVKQVYIAVAAAELPSNRPSSMGIWASDDDGKSWTLLPGAPQDYATTRLVLEPAAPNYLYGQTGVGTWRYTLK
ncbi:MAG: HEAT repeat domain-containing protein [Chloroflexi bacterium]|nr:HEAT repeat domain-containing protein [Chloroflexota bacterium]